VSSAAAERDSFEYVVIGGGSAGCVVAGRLATAGADVLVLEAGPNDARRPDVAIPAGVVRVYKTNNWVYRPEPDPSRNGAVESWPAGRILGGGGSINATVFVRGNAADYDRWAALGADGWGYDDVLPRFKRMETWRSGPDEYRGGAGPIGVEFHTMDHPANEVFTEAASQAGHPHTADYNGKAQAGVGRIQVNQRRGRRSHAAREYLRRLAPNDRLTVRTGATVERIVFTGDRAVAVEYLAGGQRRTVRAEREIILSAGAIASPRLLMLSGVGPEDELRRYGVPVVAPAAGVGDNLAEHPVVMLRWHATIPTLNRLRPGDIGRTLVNYVRSGTGNLAATVWHGQVMHRTDPGLASPDMQIAFSNFAVARVLNRHGALEVKPAKEEGFMVSTAFVHPRGRGRIRLRSASPSDPPVIDHALLGRADDVADLLAGLEEARRIMGQPAMAAITAGLFAPEAECRGPDDWEAHVRANATYGAHPVGSCRMGSDDDAVVDPRLRVRGVQRLRVVDASVMPSTTTGNTNAPSMMIGEVASDLILDDRGRR
jgi:choline dehydrogenase